MGSVVGGIDHGRRFYRHCWQNLKFSPAYLNLSAKRKESGN
jgi:hypothetical protein